MPYGDADALAAAVDDTVAAVVLEPIQGENGVVVPAGRLPGPGPGALRRRRRAALGRRGADRDGPGRLLAGPRRRGRDRRPRHRGQGAGQRVPDRGLHRQRPGGHPAGSGQPRQHLRRQPGGGDRRAGGDRGDRAGRAARAGERPRRPPGRRRARPRPSDRSPAYAAAACCARSPWPPRSPRPSPTPRWTPASSSTPRGRTCSGWPRRWWSPPTSWTPSSPRCPACWTRAGMTLRHFLADDDLTAAEQAAVLDLADALKADPYKISPLAGPRSVALLFDKPTLRTQTSFSAGVVELGGFPMIVDGRLAQIGEREPVADIARVLGRQCAAIVWRTFGQDRIEEMAAYAGVPVVNALTDQFHPCQVLADLHDHPGAPGPAGRADPGLRRRRRQQHGPLLPAGRRPGRPARPDRCAGGVLSPTRTSWSGPRRWPPRPAAACRSPSRPPRRWPAPTWSPPTPGSRWAGDRRPGPVQPLRPVRGDRRAARPARPTRSCCTACPPTAARRSRPTVLDGPRRWSGTRPRTGGTCRRRCWPSSSDPLTTVRGTSHDRRPPAGAC